MDRWIFELADRFDPGISRLHFAGDPDCLLDSPDLQALLSDRAWEIVRYGEPVEFRYRYESELLPSLLADSPGAILVDVGRMPQSEIPFDILRRGRYVPLSVHELVPNLSPPALRDVPPEDLGRVIALAAEYTGQQLGMQRTQEFLLREVYGVSPRALSRIDAFVEYLLRRHYTGANLPESLDRRLVSELQGRLDLKADPYDLLRRPEAFFAWLQADWNEYVDAHRGNTLREGGVPYEASPGIRVYLDNLFVEGRLDRVSLETANVPGWMRPGISLPGDDPEGEFRAHLGQLDGTWPHADASHRAWIAFAWRWAELRARIGVAGHDLDTRLALVSELKPVQLPMEQAFDEWLRRRYGLLPSLVSMNAPIMVHQISGVLERGIRSGERVALLVMDGMALDHWVTLRGLLSGHGNPVECGENACFACLPTLTSVSRQAIFAGRLPSSFPETWNTTAKESVHWERLGGDWGLPPAAIRYTHLRLRNLPEGADPCALVPDLDDYRTRLMAIVVPDIDELAHAAKLGMADMQHDIRLWGAAGTWARLIKGLLVRGFTVYVTADHGSVEAEGKGQPREGVTVDQRAMRARVYEREEYLAPVLAAHPFAREWPPIGLPEGLRVLVPEQLAAFAPRGEIVVAHGGPSLEEVIVPFVRLRRVS